MSTAEFMLSSRGLFDIGPSRTRVGESTIPGYADPSAKVNEPVPQSRPSVEHDVYRISVESADLAATDWIAAAFDTLERMRSLSSDWHSCGANPPNSAAVSSSTRVLQKLAEEQLAPDVIEPSSDEGVCIAFERGQKYAGIECFNTGENLAVLSDGKNAPIIWEVSRASLQETIARISEFISG